MAEPASTVYLPLSVAAAFASLFPGIDGNALIGAFAGAALIVVTSKDLTIFKRFAYLVISLVIGYQGGPEIINATPIKSTGVASFFAAAIAITLALQLVERIKAFDLLSLFKKGS
jgi:hypothetical protein